MDAKTSGAPASIGPLAGTGISHPALEPGLQSLGGQAFTYLSWGPNAPGGLSLDTVTVEAPRFATQQVPFVPLHTDYKP